MSKEMIDSKVAEPSVHIHPRGVILAVAAGTLLGTGLAAGLGDGTVIAREATLLMGLLGGGTMGLGWADVEHRIEDVREKSRAKKCEGEAVRPSRS